MLWKCYIDIFLIWTGTNTQLETFITNQGHIQGVAQGAGAELQNPPLVLPVNIARSVMKSEKLCIHTGQTYGPNTKGMHRRKNLNT